MTPDKPLNDAVFGKLRRENLPSARELRPDFPRGPVPAARHARAERRLSPGQKAFIITRFEEGKRKAFRAERVAPGSLQGQPPETQAPDSLPEARYCRAPADMGRFICRSGKPRARTAAPAVPMSWV
ncbi:MAG: hypothetical protein HYU77_04000 [Betaproteobacteria bacterium]|nr:hypothetical protein [Betaproteobacteria bacterium]